MKGGLVGCSLHRVAGAPPLPPRSWPATLPGPAPQESPGVHGVLSRFWPWCAAFRFPPPGQLSGGDQHTLLLSRHSPVWQGGGGVPEQESSRRSCLQRTHEPPAVAGSSMSNSMPLVQGRKVERIYFDLKLWFQVGQFFFKHKLFSRLLVLL